MTTAYSAAFRTAVAAVLEHEGGTFENDPVDTGGATRWGISARQYPGKDIVTLTKDDAIELYWSDYWAPLGLDVIHPKVAAKLLDMAVHLGPYRAVAILQEALCYLCRSVKVDGQLGPLTRNAVSSVNKPALLAAMCGRQFREYERQITTQPPKQKYAAGWAVRAIWVPA